MIQHKIKFFKKAKIFQNEKNLNGGAFPKELEINYFNNNAFPPNYILIKFLIVIHERFYGSRISWGKITWRKSLI